MLYTYYYHIATFMQKKKLITLHLTFLLLIFHIGKLMKNKITTPKTLCFSKHPTQFSPNFPHDT